ncbi:hypothetical protein MMC07_006662 [Pseudocyphellaria aurata]|nr:hypothetical protein [Pseudocyphellaria aurata]
MQLPTILAILSALPVLFASPAPSHFLANARASFKDSPPYCPPRPATPAQQRAIFNTFVTKLYTDKNATGAFLDHVAVDLIEHDPFDAQGRDANAAKLEGIIPFASFAVQRHTFDDNIGFIHLRVEENPGPVALADIYRLNGTCIVEHWDIAQVYPANATNKVVPFF